MTEVTTRGPGRLPGSTIKRLSAVIRARYGLHNDLPLDIMLAAMEYWAAQCAKLVDREAEAATTVVLTDKALAAMNVVPPALNRTRGSELVEKHHWLIIACDACDTVIDLDLTVKRRDPDAPIRVALNDVRCPRCNGHGRTRIVGLSRYPSI